MHQRINAATIQLAGQAREVISFLALPVLGRIGQGRDEEPPLILGSRRRPGVVGNQNQANERPARLRIHPLAFKGGVLIGDQMLQRTLIGVRASPEALLDHRQQLVAHVGIEVAGQLPGVGNHQPETAQRGTEPGHDNRLADTLAASQDQSYVRFLSRELEDMC